MTEPEDWPEEDTTCVVCLRPSQARLILELREDRPDITVTGNHGYCGEHLKMLMVFAGAMQDFWLQIRAMGNGG